LAFVDPAKMLLKSITFFLLLFGFSLVLIEGLSSSLLVLYPLTRPAVRETVHTQYDKELGWVNIPNIEIKDMYGPGLFFKTNSQGFRNQEDFTVNVTEGKVRVICSGDSFTLGYGVDNHHTWCHQLTTIDDRLETVNMGQGGYGIDQAFLWYMRDGAKLQHDLHVFALITDDFQRMKTDNFRGFGKPVLQLKNNVLVSTNVPVPQRSYFIPRLTEAIQKLKNFRALELLTKVYLKILPPPQNISSDLMDDQTYAVASKVFETLAYTNEMKDSIMVLVYLPTFIDYCEDTSEIWRESLKVLSADKGFVFIDLVEPFKKLPRSEIVPLFRGHYSEQGNRYIARSLYETLLSVDEISRRFGQKRSSKRRSS
jgi:hypothetical protein